MPLDSRYRLSAGGALLFHGRISWSAAEGLLRSPVGSDFKRDADRHGHSRRRWRGKPALPLYRDLRGG